MTLCLIAAPLTLSTGCSITPNAPRAKVFLALKDVWVLKDKAMRVYAQRVVAGKVSNEQRSRVWAMHSKFQASYDMALVLTGFDTTKTAPDDLINVVDQLIVFINNL